MIVHRPGDLHNKEFSCEKAQHQYGIFSFWFENKMSAIKSSTCYGYF